MVTKEYVKKYKKTRARRNVAFERVYNDGVRI